MERKNLWSEYPDYRVDLEPHPGRVTVRVGETVVAESERALLVLETKHDPVVYFPREDVRFEHLERTAHDSFCPFKGEASYWTIRAGERVAENAVWSYEAPFDEVAGLKDYCAFYADRTEMEKA